jgi:carboxypeptidase family protein
MPGSVRRLVMFGVVALFPSLLYAQASITGTVRDPSGAVLPGVTVEAASPALIEKVRSAVTDGTGQYRIIDLRPGTYAVAFTLTGFAPVKREGIELAGSFVATVNADLQVGSVAETVTVSGQTPIVDVQSTQTQRVLNNEVIAALPTGRTPMSLATLIPGAVGFLGAQDVGGTDSLGAINGQFSIHGGSNNDMRVMTESFYTGGNRSGLQFGNNQPNVGSTEEVSIDVAGNTAERAEGGILINFVPKAGGNKYSGSLFVSGTGSGLSGSNLTQRVKDLGFETDVKVKNTYDINPAFGGPIKQDKLWFFTSTRFFGYENYTGMLGNKNAGINNVWTYVPDPGNRLFNKAYSRDANLRLTYQINPKNKLSVFWDSQFKCECQQTGNSSFWSKLSGLIVSQEAAPAFWIYPTDTGTVTWSSLLTTRLLLEAGAAYRREDYHVPVRNWRTGDPLLDQINVLDVGTNIVYHGVTGGGGPTAAGNFTDSISWTPQFRAALSYVAGAHSLKVGFNDTYLKAHDSTLINTTGTAYIFFNGTPIFVTEKTASNTAGSVPWDLGIYAQERWTHKRLTLDLGLRYSYFENYSPDQPIGPTLHLPNRNFVLPAATFFKMKDLTPRLGAAYDLFGNGKTALKVAANKYLVAPPPLAGNPSTTLINSANRSWNDSTFGAGDRRTGNFVPDCDLTNVAANSECGPLPRSFGQAVSAATFDPATYQGWGVRQYNWEFSGSVQHELMKQVSVDVGYFRRIYGSLQVQYNRALPASAYDAYTVTAPTDPRLGSNSGQVISGLYDIKPAFTVGGIATDIYQTMADSIGKMYTHWNGVDIGVRARMAKLNVSGGLSTGRTSLDNCDVVGKVIAVNPASVTTTSAGLVPFATSPLYCHQDTKFLTQVKGYAAYSLPAGVQLAATFQSIPGQALAANVTYTSAQVAQSLGRPLSTATTVTVNVIPPGTLYGDRLNQLDLRLGKDFRVQRYRINASVDLYNVLNSDAVLNENGAYAAWRRPQSLVRPFFVKFGGQISF